MRGSVGTECLWATTPCRHNNDMHLQCFLQHLLLHFILSMISTISKVPCPSQGSTMP